MFSTLVELLESEMNRQRAVWVGRANVFSFDVGRDSVAYAMAPGHDRRINSPHTNVIISAAACRAH